MKCPYSNIEMHISTMAGLNVDMSKSFQPGYEIHFYNENKMLHRI